MSDKKTLVHPQKELFLRTDFSKTLFHPQIGAFLWMEYKEVEPQCAKIASKYLITCISGAYNLTMKNGALRFHVCQKAVAGTIR